VNVYYGLQKHGIVDEMAYVGEDGEDGEDGKDGRGAIHCAWPSHWTCGRRPERTSARSNDQRRKPMKGLMAACLILTVFGALNAVWSGLGGPDLIHMAMGPARTVGTDFLRILTGLAAMATLVWGLRAIRAGK